MSNVFKVGVEFLFDSNALGFFGGLSGHLLGLNRHLIESQTRINGMATAIKGLAVAAAGLKTLKFEFGLSQHGADLQHQIALLQRQGDLKPGDLELAVKAAYRQAAETPAAGSVADEVGLLRELKSQLPDMQTAIAALPFFAKLKETIAAFSPTGTASDSDMLMGLKALEFRGKAFREDPKTGKMIIDPEALKIEGDDLERAIISSGGLFQTRDALQMARQAGPAGRMSADAFYGKAVEMGVIMGSSKAGTAMFSMFQELLEGTMSAKTLGRLIDAHLVNPKFVKYDKDGKPSELLPGGLKDSSLAYSDTFAWLQEAFATLKKDHPKATDQDLYIMFSSLFGRQTTQREATEAIQAEPEFANKMKNYKATAGTADNAAFLQTNDPTTVMKGFTNAWETMLQALGSPLVQPVNQMLLGLTHVFSDISGFAAAHPTFVKDLGYIATGLAGIAVVVGGAAFLSGVAALATGGGSFVAVAAGISAVVAAIGTAIAVLPDLAHWIENLVPTWARPTPTLPGPAGHANPGQASGGYHPTADLMYHRGAPQITNVVYLDGEQISHRTVQKLSYGLSHQQTGVSGWDTSLTAPHVGPALSI